MAVPPCHLEPNAPSFCDAQARLRPKWQRGCDQRAPFQDAVFAVPNRMERRLGHHLTGFLAALLIVAGSFFSASAMGRTDPGGPELAAYVLGGGSVADLCGETLSGSDDHCQYCRLLVDPVDIGPAPCIGPVLYSLTSLDLRDLTRGPQGGNPHVSARAPPAVT